MNNPKYYVLAVALVLIGLVASSVRADTVETFNVSGTFSGDPNLGFATPTLGTLGGTVTIDTTTGTIPGPTEVGEGGTIYVFGPISTAVFSFPSQFALPGGYTEITEGEGPYAALILILPTTSLVGYTGSSLCSVISGNCRVDPNSSLVVDPFFSESAGSYQQMGTIGAALLGVPDGTDFFLTSGSLTPVPEPSSAALLSTGLLGLLVVSARRRQRLA